MGRKQSGAVPLITVTGLTILLLFGEPVIDDWQLDQRISRLLNCEGGIHVEDMEGNVLLSWHGNTPLIPASVLKLATATFVLDKLGEDHRPETTFFYDTANHVLCVRGSGDPFLVSDELRIIADSLVAIGVDTVRTLIADCSNFRDHLKVEGRGNSSNPYDAGFGAFFVNFNTVSVRIGSDGSILPGEKETPLTSLAYARARHLRSPGMHRISILDGDFSGPLYALELLRAILLEKGVYVREDYDIGACEDSLDCLRYTHRNSRTLSEMVTSMLKFSNNVVANTLLLHTLHQRTQTQPSVDEGAQALTEFLREKFGIQDVVIHEGSGLSRDNRIRPSDVVAIIRYMVQRGWHAYLPEYEHARAKSGTLNGISCLAGTFQIKDGTRLLFAILLDGPLDRRDRALQLLRELFG